jgi:ATPase complex subunit ATP10
VEEATKSYFHDINGNRDANVYKRKKTNNRNTEMKEHGGKMYYANTQLMKPEMTGYMPDFEVQDLSKNKIHTTDKLLDKISLVTISLTQFGFVNMTCVLYHFS